MYCSKRREIDSRTRSVFLLLFMFFLWGGVIFAQSNSGENKTITYKCSNQPLQKALMEVERLSGYYRIQYVMADVESYTVTADLKDATIGQAVAQLLKGTPLKYEISGRFVQVYNPNNQSQRKQGDGTVRGQVFDEQGEPLIGVTVRVPGSKTGAVTDMDGRFTLRMPKEGGKLLFSYIGKKDVEMEPSSRPLRVVMEDNTRLLDDVVVTGYQTLSRERVTGSFDKVDQEILAARPSADISSALQGLVAGMQATENEDGSVDFLIRGTSSLYAETAPLIVVDGFPIEGTFSSINPNDVESVTVLKDAAAASIWGARSANGVIVVTTKRAKQNSRLNVDVQTFWRIGTEPDIDYITSQADSRTTVDYEIMALENGWNMGEYTPGYTSIQSPLSLAMEYWYANKYRGMSEEEMNAGLERLRNINNRGQLKKYLMQTPLLQQYNVSISGGTEKFDNYVSLMYEQNDEATIKRGYERFMINYNGTYRFNKNITGTIAATWQKRRQETSGVTISEFTNLSPYELLVNEDGSYATNIYGFNRFELEDMNTADFPYSDFSYNMLREVRDRSYITNTMNWRVQVGLNVKLFKGLTYDIKYQYERNTSDYRNMDGEDTYAARRLVNFYTAYDSSTGTVGTSYLPKGAVVRTGDSENHNHVFRNQLTYNNTFGGKHEVSALAGIELSEYVTSSTTNPTIYGYNVKTNTAQAPFYGSYDTIENMVNDSWSSTLPEQGYTFSDRVDRYLSYFFNAGYTYDDRYGASFSIRYDGANFVSDDPDLRWSPMWSIGGKWNISKESFMSDVRWIDYLSLRATYGLNGNAERSTSPQTLISVYANSTTHGNVASITSLGNPTLRWETTYTTNIGLDFSLFKNYLSGKFDVYNRMSKDVIGTVAIPSVYGSSSQRFNNAKISNRGFELELSANIPVKSIGLGINSTVTFAYNKNKVEELYYPNNYCYQYMYASDPANGSFIEGRPIGAVYAYEFAGMEDGDPYVWGPDGTKVAFGDLSLHNSTYGSEEFLSYKGTTISPYTLGWANQFTWKGLSLYVFITGKFGGVFRAPTSYTPPLVGDSKTFVSKYISDYAESDGTQLPTFPKVGDTTCYRWDRYMTYLSYFVEDAAFLRLKEVSLSYQLPAKWMNRLHIKQAKVFCQARDLGLIWTANKYGYDPEWLPGDGYGSGATKPAASFTLGVNLNF